MKITKWQHELGRYYKRGKLVSYFHNATKTCLYGLKISENTKIGHLFQSRTFFHLSSNLHTSCFSAFKLNLLKKFWNFIQVVLVLENSRESKICWYNRICFFQIHENIKSNKEVWLACFRQLIFLRLYLIKSLSVMVNRTCHRTASKIIRKNYICLKNFILQIIFGSICFLKKRKAHN